MPVNTKTVTDRRTIRYDNVNALLKDAERIAQGPHKAMGNWSAGQIFRHLATVMNGAIDGLPFRVPWYIRIVARLLYKKKALKGPLPTGFQLPKRAAVHLVPSETSTEEGLHLLRQAIQRFQTESKRAPSPIFGVMTPEEWDQLQLRHAEMHMSFLIPA